MGKRGFTYADAALLMGGANSDLVRRLDAVLGGVLLAATAGTSELAISLFDAKSEMTKLSERLVQGLTEKRQGLGRLDQNERMAAAQAVIVVMAFFEAVQAADLPLKVEDLGLGKEGQSRLVLGEILREETPELQMTSTALYNELLVLVVHRRAARSVFSYVAGLEVWDRWSDTEKDSVRSILLEVVPEDAALRWEMHFRRLAVEFPELSFHVDRLDHETTRQSVGIGLAGLEQKLQAVADRFPASGELTRDSLVRRYVADLKRPIVDSVAAPGFLQLPTLEKGYVDPDFRVAAATAEAQVHLAGFWSDLPVRNNLPSFLAAYFGSLGATLQLARARAARSRQVGADQVPGRKIAPERLSRRPSSAAASSGECRRADPDRAGHSRCHRRTDLLAPAFPISRKIHAGSHLRRLRRAPADDRGGAVDLSARSRRVPAA